MIEPHIKALGDGIDQQTGQHDPGGILEDGGDTGGSPVVGGGDIQQPGLRKDDKSDGSDHAQGNSPVGLLFSSHFT